MARQEKVIIDGVEYTLQHPGAVWYLDMNDRCRGPHGLKMLPYAKEVLEHVVIEPRLSVEDFDDDLAALEKLLSEVEKFLRRKKKQSNNKAKGQE